MFTWLYATAGRAWVTLFAVTLLCYATALPNGFAYDDVPMIQRNPVIEEGQPWWRPWTEPYWFGSNEGDVIDVLYRPLTVQTYGWQRRLFGLHPFSFHLVNVILHASVSCVLGLLAMRLGLTRGAAWIAALVFAVHPIHVEAVANGVGRAEILSALGLVVALLAVDARARLQPDAVGGRGRSVWLMAAAAVFAAVAMFSKESGAAVILAAVAWHGMAMGREPSDGAGGRRGRVFRILTGTLVPLVLIFVLYLAIRYEVCAGRLSVGGQRGGPGNFLREADTATRMWSPWAVLGRYLALMVWPDPLLCDYSLRVVLPVRNPLEPYALLGLGVTGVVGWKAVRSLRGDRRWAVVAVGFAASYALPSNMFMHIDVLMAERLFYAPSLWVCLGLGLAIDGWRGLTTRKGRMDPAVSAPWWKVAAAAALMTLAIRTALRNPAWADTATLMQTDYAQMTPGRRSAPVCTNLGRQVLAAGDVEAARRFFEESVAMYPDAPAAHAGLGEVFTRLGRFDLALRSWERAVELAPNTPDLIRGREEARARLEGRRPELEVEAARTALAESPDDRDRIRRWAQVNELTDPAESARAYERLLRMDPNDVASWKSLAYVRFYLGLRGGAVEAYGRALTLAPNDWEAHTGMAVLLMDRTDAAYYKPDEAVRHARRAVELNPTQWTARVNLAEVLAHCGHPREAADLFDALADQCDRDSTQQRLFRDRASALRR